MSKRVCAASSSNKTFPATQETLEKKLWKKYSNFAQPPIMFFNRFPFEKWYFSSCNDNWLCQKKVCHWVKPADPIFFTLALLIGGALLTMLAEPGSIL